MKAGYITLSIPIFFLLIGIELAFSIWKKKKLYRFNDSLTNITLGIGSQITGVLLKGALGFGYLYLYHRFGEANQIPNTILIGIVLFLGVDFFYYWFHRMSHEVNFLWAAHIVHHQSEDYNLSVALRQSWIQGWFSWVFYLPLALVGFEPTLFFALSSFNTLYQFWIHTTTIKSLGPLEWVLNTPSHHRVHHGSNPKYIDKNHAGTLIIWDRMFGTFYQEEEEPVYGITKALNSWNPVWANVHYWQELWNLSKVSRGLDKIKVFLKPPGWQPEYLGGFQAPHEIDKRNYRKYDLNALTQEHYYSFFLFLTSLGVATAVLFLKDVIGYMAMFAISVYVFVAITTLGGMIENRSWVIPLEYARIIGGLIITLLLWETPFYSDLLTYVSLFTLINLVWFSRVAFNLRTKLDVKVA